MSVNCKTVPVIDVGALAAPGSDAYRQLCEELEQVYSTLGFSYIRNHGISRRLLAEIFDASAAFHALPAKKKSKMELDRNHRGFIPIYSATDVNSEIEGARRSNHSESFIMMREADSRDPDVLAGSFLAGPNQWPMELPGFRERVMNYYDAIVGLSHKLLKAMIRSIDADFSEIQAYFERPTTFLRLLHYPTLPADAPEGMFGSAAHVDFGCLTLLAQDDVEGLQAREPGGNWLDVPPIQDTFVMNVGSMLNRWSNGHFHSTPHRVIAGTKRARYSISFFYDPHIATQVAPLESCLSQQNPARFEPVTYGEFVRRQLGATYSQHQSNHE